MGVRSQVLQAARIGRDLRRSADFFLTGQREATKEHCFCQQRNGGIILGQS